MCGSVAINIISGFLGAGKTTVISEIAAQLKGKEKIAVLVNEFGKLGIDGDIFQGKNIAVKEIPEGCICCSLKGSLISALEEIALKFKPERLLIEPTGLAQPVQILETLCFDNIKKLYHFENITTIVDALNYPRYYKAIRRIATEQITMATNIIVNKIDKVEKEDLDNLIKIIKEINPNSILYLTEFGQLDAELLFQNRALQFTAPKKLEGKTFSSFVYQDSSYYDTEKLKKVIEELVGNKYGEVIRAKGIFKVAGNRQLKIDVVMNEIDYKFDEINGNSKFIIIGQDLQEKLLEDTFWKCVIDKEFPKDGVVI